MRRITEPRVTIVINEPKNDKVAIRRSGRAYCPLCREVVELLSFPGAALLFKTECGSMDLRTRDGDLHRLHNRSGELMICSRSLRKYIAGDRRLQLDVGPQR